MTSSPDVHDSIDETLKLNPPGCSFSAQKRPIVEKAAYHGDSTSQKRTRRDEVTEDLVELQEDVSAGGRAASIVSGFLTAGTNREIKISEHALKIARARLFSDPGTFSDDEDMNRDDLITTRPVDCGGFLGFVTAGTNKVVTVSNSALEAAKRRLHTAVDDDVPSSSNSLRDVENLDPSRFFVASTSKGSIRAVSGSELTPVTRRSSRGQANSPLQYPVVSKPSDLSFESSRRVTSEEKSAAIGPGKDNMVSPRITCVRDLRNCQLTNVDFLGIIVESTMSCQNRLCSTPLLKVADRYGESVSVEVLSSSIPSNISRGSVISVDGALIKRQKGDVSIVINDSTFVDLEPNDPEAKCLHHLYLTGLFDSGVSEDSFTFDRSTLRMIGRLNEYPGEVSTVMARICGINTDSLFYLGCTSCKKSVIPASSGITSCLNCRNKKARYFYSFTMELADFTGIVSVKVTDNAAEKLIGKPAGGMVKLEKAALKTRLSSLYFRPMLFRISNEQNSSLWVVDDWKQLDILKFKPFLRKVAEQKGYK